MSVKHETHIVFFGLLAMTIFRSQHSLCENQIKKHNRWTSFLIHKLLGCVPHGPNTVILQQCHIFSSELVQGPGGLRTCWARSDSAENLSTGLRRHWEQPSRSPALLTEFAVSLSLIAISSRLRSDTLGPRGRGWSGGHEDSQRLPPESRETSVTPP